MLISMPHLKSINFYHKRPKIKFFLQNKNKKIFERVGLSPTPPKQSPLQISGYAHESNHVFALLVFMPPKFSLMPRLKIINFYQNKPQIKSFLQNNKIFRVLGALPPAPDTQLLPTADFWFCV